MTQRELREQIGVAFVQAGLSTRQTAISDILQLINQHVKEVIACEGFKSEVASITNISDFNKTFLKFIKELKAEQLRRAGL